jgi:hypothetical protein
VFSDREERGALRLFLRALRRLPEELAWEAVIYSKTGAVPTLRSSLRHRVQVVHDEDLAIKSADVVVSASLGQVTAPGVLVRALGAGAVPLAARVPVYEEVLHEGDVGLLFQVGDVEVLAGQLERLVRDDALRARLAERGGAARVIGQVVKWADTVPSMEALPGMVEHVDDLIERGVIGGPERNAADFQIATSLSLLLTMEDIRPLIEGRPAGRLARDVVRRQPGHMPRVYAA